MLSTLLDVHIQDSDPLIVRRSRSLAMLLLILIGISIPLALVDPLLIGNAQGLIINGAAILLFLAIYLINRSGQLALATTLLLAGFSLIPIGASALSGTPFPQIFFPCLIVVIAAALGSPRAPLIWAMIASFIPIAINLVLYGSVAPPPGPIVMPDGASTLPILVMELVALALYWMLAGISWLASRQLADTIAESRAATQLAVTATDQLALSNTELQTEIVERMQAEAELEGERAVLERRIAERTADLRVLNIDLARAAQLKDEFLTSMSHELRTPLNAVLGLSEALQEQVFGSLNDKQQHMLHCIEESGRHLLALITDILDLSKIEAGKFELDIDLVPVEPVCQASLRLIKQAAHNQQLTVSLQLDSAVTTIPADMRRLKQMLVNLLSNAVKFTAPGGAIGLDVAGDAARNVVTFTVWDTGIGIAPDDLARLFQPFVQLDSRLARQYAGTGLGLSLVSRMVELHGGSITVTSEPNTGSRFVIALPWKTLEAIDSEELGALDIAAAPHPIVVHRALIIEDSPAAAEQLSRYLHELDVETVAHAQGDGTVALAREARPDVIFLDILLPASSGWDILAQLKDEPATQGIPVLIVSVVDEQRRAMTLGAAGYLVKPITRQQVQAALNRISVQRAPDESQVSRVETGRGQPPNRPVILLAEDNEVNITTLADYLSIKGYQVVIARNGAEAIERATELPPDLILIDIQMPGMDGLEAICRIRANPTLGMIPIIALTALAMPGDRERCLKAGANDYLSKPVSLTGLVAAIDTHLHRAAASAEANLDTY
jgi:signal transduction histidine kinase/DNA-binding response OmpR family regulator